MSEMDDADCREAIHRLYHFLDGELTPVKKSQIERHLDGCLPCVQAFDFETDLRRLIAERCRDTVPEALRERIAMAIHHETIQHEFGPVDGGTSGIFPPGTEWA